MPKKKLTYPTNFSASSYASMYDKTYGCPRKYKAARIEKHPKAPGSYAMERGIDIHKKAEYFLMGEIKTLPSELKKFRTEFIGLRKAKALPEAFWRFNNSWQLTESWHETFCVMKVDAIAVDPDEKVVTVIDFKTGRVKPYRDQEELYATGAHKVYPDAEEIDVEFWYLDHGQVTTENYTLSRLKYLADKWKDKGEKFLKTKRFPMRPGAACKYCYYRSDNQMSNGSMGPCNGWKQA